MDQEIKSLLLRLLAEMSRTNTALLMLAQAMSPSTHTEDDEVDQDPEDTPTHTGLDGKRVDVL